MLRYKIHPEVPGGIGKNTTYDKTQIPWKIIHLHVIFEGWLGGDLLKVSSCYLVTDQLKEKLLSENLIGIRGFVEFEKELSGTFKNLYPGKSLPHLSWMQLEHADHADLYIGEKNKLIISEHVIKVLQSVNLSDAEFEVIS